MALYSSKTRSSSSLARLGNNWYRCRCYMLQRMLRALSYQHSPPSCERHPFSSLFQCQYSLRTRRPVRHGGILGYSGCTISLTNLCCSRMHAQQALYRLRKSSRLEMINHICVQSLKHSFSIPREAEHLLTQKG